ncbi:MAG TPA: diguanylate cyclase [Gammaproteobacteria bacterium]|jgi:diguanylate cyclase (GGDEF)-like protein|nr:diguanylate cyclase [Gammaproteobacteria bacterium]
MDLTKLDPQDHGSPFAEQLQRGFSNLRFAAPLERDFREFYVAQNLARARLSGLIALVLVLALTCIDLVFGSPALGKLNALRLGVLCPLLLLLAAAVALPVARRYYTEIVSVGVTLVGFVVTYITHVASLAGASYVLAGLVLVVLFGCLFLGLLFNVAIAVAALLIAAHFVSGLVVGLPLDVLSYMTAILGAAAVIGGIATYNLEHALRTNFLETRLLNELAERDGMTGLYNRRIFDDYIYRIWRQSRREGTAIAIVFVDIDFFKIFNDLYGHQAGDDCLKKVAKCIARGAKRPFDFSARYGGEEFVLVLYDPPEDYARGVPEQIRRDVLDLAIPHAGSQAAKFVTVSVGLSLARPDSTHSLAGAIQMADEALYLAKREGRNRVVCKDSDDSEVETGNFRVVYRDLR